MTNFLILHKVRGAPAFDIATRCDDMGTPSDLGPWWIIPTSGHRAYPWRWWDLEDLRDVSDINQSDNSHSCPMHVVYALPEGWPDHYHCNDRPSRTATRIVGDLLSALGLKRSPEIRRRKF